MSEDMSALNAALQSENTTLKRRINRMQKEFQHMVNLHERATQLRDYSEREKELQYEYNFLLLENAPDMMFVLGPDMKFRLATNTFIRFFRSSHTKELMGISFADFMKPVMSLKWIADIMKKFEQVIRDKSSLKYEDELSHNGENKYFSVAIAPAVNSKSEVMGIICVMHDTSELVLMKEAAETATKAKSSFLASMSHEIRTPMNAIKGLTDLMSLTELTSQQAAYIATTQVATSNLLTIIDDILDFSKIEANRYEIIPVVYDVGAMFVELCSLLQPKVDDKGINFSVFIAPDIPAEMIGDVTRIKQILINLINNAIKFTHQGGVRLDVNSNTIHPGECEILVQIIDTGQGIREKELSKIFHAFEQADYYKNRNIAGTGLGLAISKNLVELMGGTISAFSVYGEGSIFTVKIPQKIHNTAPIAKVERQREIRLLFLCENETKRIGMEKMLKSLGVNYAMAKSCHEFSQFFESNQYTHVLFDHDGDVDIITRYENALKGCAIASVKNIKSYTLSELPEFINVIFEPVLTMSLAGFLNDETECNMVQSKLDDTPGEFKLEKLRVLIVDDNEINLLVASEIVKYYEIEPDTALSGEEALVLVSKNEYDMILMDHMMPGMDGIQTTQLIRAMPLTQRPYIVALTANAIIGMEDIYLSSGFDGYITKPIEISKLNEIFARWAK